MFKRKREKDLKHVVSTYKYYCLLCRTKANIYNKNLFCTEFIISKHNNDVFIIAKINAIRKRTAKEQEKEEKKNKKDVSIASWIKL